MVLQTEVFPSTKALANQGHLGNLLRSIFAGENIQENVRKESSITNPSTGVPLEIDIWIPDLKLCFEFQDPHHYAPVWKNHLSIAQVQEKDNIKREGLLARLETLYLIPCWWDGEKESLLATIQFQRPDLFPEHTTESECIPLNCPLDFFEYYSIPDAGDLMLASLPTSSQFLSTITPDNPWWMGEKYDGVRFCWNAKNLTLYLRTGQPVALPEAITRSFPGLFLDGEIWFGKGFYAESRSILSDDHLEADWSMLKFVVFDELRYKFDPFEYRYQRLLLTSPEHPFVVNASRRMCTAKKQLSRAMKIVLSDGGEGLVLRKPKSFYEAGRSTNLIKLKAYKGDREALVIKEPFEEDGDYLSLLLPEGKIIRARKTNANYQASPCPGDVVTFAFSNFSPSAVPTRPFILRVRTELSWGQVLADYFHVASDEPKLLTLNAATQRAFGLSPMPKRYWTAQAGNNLKRLFMRFARARGFDALVANNWYSVTMNDIRKFSEGRLEVVPFRNIASALLAVFPNIGLDSCKFPGLKKDFWREKTRRRKFMDDFAALHKFDPLLPDNWYSIRNSHISAQPGGSSFLNWYKNSLRRAVIALYPNLKLDIAKFGKSKEDVLADFFLKKRFDKLAAAFGFDPLVADNWHEAKLHWEHTQSARARAIIMRRYKGSFVQALLHMYPDIGLQEEKLTRLQVNFTEETKRVRSMFDEFAHSNNFDPLVPANWYSVPKEKFQEIKGAGLFLGYFKHRGYAIACLYPEIELDTSKFREYIKGGHFSDPANRRAFFDKFARTRGFDPLIAANWYSITANDLETQHGFESLRVRYSSSIDAVKDAYPSIKWQMKFRKSPDAYWNDIKNIRNFFDNFAAERGFDPLNVENWYAISQSEIHKTRDGYSATHKFHDSPSRSILAAYPELQFDLSKFAHSPSKYWANEKNRKQFFDSFAAEHKFDPLLAENWYNYKSLDICKHKHGFAVLAYYKNSFSQALCQLYPTITFEPWQFSRIPTKFYDNPEQRKQYFVRLAKANNFDPLLARNWHDFKFTQKELLEKTAKNVLPYYADTREALMDCFPNIGLQPEMFKSIKSIKKHRLKIERKLNVKKSAG